MGQPIKHIKPISEADLQKAKEEAGVICHIKIGTWSEVGAIVAQILDGPFKGKVGLIDKWTF